MAARLEDATLVLGASGFLGAHVVAAAVELARRAATFADPLGPPVHAVARRPELAPRFSTPREAARWIAADLAEPGAAEGLLDELRPRRVLCCAALARVAACQADPAAAERLNRELPAAVARWCAAAGARLLHVSTDLVFGASDAPPDGFDERAPAGPLSVYGRSKAAGEEAVLAACPAALVVRLPLLYGNSGGRGMGASDALLEAVDRDERPPLFVDEWRTPLEVRAAADALVELAAGAERGRLHVAGPDRLTRHELGIEVLLAMGLERPEAEAAVRPARRAELPGVQDRPRDVSLDARRARRLVATELPGVREGLARAMR